MINKPHYSHDECLMLTFVLHSAVLIYLDKITRIDQKMNTVCLLVLLQQKIQNYFRVWVSDRILKNGTLQDKGVRTING